MLARKKFFLHALFILFITSCSEDEVKDTKVPTLEFVQESETQFTGIVDLTFNTSDNKSVARIQIFVDGDMIKDETLSSGNESFSFYWDTKTVEDGTHELKVIVTDATGNSTEETFTIVVKNDLLRLFIPENYISSDALWVFLSDHSGNLLGVQQAQNNTELVFPVVDGFTDEKLMIHLFNYTFIEGGTGQDQMARSIFTYTNVTPGVFHLTSSSEAVDSDHGAAVITINDIPVGFSSASSGIDLLYSFGSYSDPNTFVVQTSLAKDQAEILVTLYNDDGRAYYKLFDGSVGDEISVSFNEFAEMNKNLVSTPGAESVFLMQVGFRPGAPVTEGFVYNFNTVFNQNEISSYHPDNTIFSSYTTVISTWYGDDQFEYLTHGALPPTIFKKSTADLTSYDFTNRKIKMSLNNNDGELIYALSYGDNSTEATYSSDSWYVFMPYQSEIDFTLPELPTEIVSACYPEGLVLYPFNEVTLDNNTGGDTYEQVINTIFNADGSEGVTDYETVRRIKHLSDPTGRTIPTKNMRERNLSKNGLKFFPLPDQFLNNYLIKARHFAQN